MNVRKLADFGIILAAWLMATGALGACPFFQPTAPEVSDRPAIIPDYSTPTLALQTIARGFVDKGSDGRSVYLGAFAESTLANRLDGRAYHAFFDLRDLIQHPSWSGDWTKDFEPFVYDDLVSDYPSPFEMTWEPYRPAGNESGGLNDSLLHRKYRLVQVVQTGNTIRRDPLAVGAADLYFVRSERDVNKWVIALWQDYHTADADSGAVTLGKRRLETR